MINARQLVNNIRNWVNQLDFQDPDKKLSAFYIQAISLIIIMGGSIIAVMYAFVGQFGYVTMVVLIMFSGSISIVLVRLKKT